MPTAQPPDEIDGARCAPEDEGQPDHPPSAGEFPVGIIGAGFIIDSVALRAYARAGINVVAIASRHAERADAVAKRWGIPRSYGEPAALLDDNEVRILEVAYPPHLQVDLIRQAAKKDHIAAVLAQKPLALSLAEARQAVDALEQEGKVLAVNQNMRFDAAVRLAKRLIASGQIGQPMLASIEMHAVPHWQSFLRDYQRLTVANMSVHHYDSLRWLLGTPLQVFSTSLRDPRTTFDHSDGLVTSVIRFESGAIGQCLEDTWVGPTKWMTAADSSVRWRVTGERGVIEGTCGWPEWPNEVPSTARYLSDNTEGSWVQPHFKSAWFPDAFGAVMLDLQESLRRGSEPENSGRDHLNTLAMVEASYRSMSEARSVDISEVW
jgi:predicted dehydrogenase